MLIVCPLNIVATCATVKANGAAAALALLFPKIVPAVIFAILANVTFEFKIFAVVTASFAIVNAVAPVTSPVCVAFGELFVIVTAPVPPLRLIPVPATLLVTPLLLIVTVVAPL